MAAGGRLRLWGDFPMLILLLIALFLLGVFMLTGLGPALLTLLHNARGRRRD